MASLASSSATVKRSSCCVLATLIKTMPPATLLQRALPLLKKEFAKKATKEGLFPIFNSTQLQQAWKKFPKRPANRGAAVLVPICSFEDQPSILFTKRAAHLSSHSSEISFPGGHIEKTDATLEDAALRETREEIATPMDSVIIIGKCTAVPSIKGIPVTPVIAVLPNEIEQSMLTGDPSEVDDVFCRSIESLLEEETSRHLGRLGRPAPVYPSPHGDIWGLTAFVLRPILHKLWQPVVEELRIDDDDEQINTL